MSNVATFTAWSSTMMTRPLLRFLLNCKYFRGRNRLARFVSRFTRVADSVYGPTLQVRHADWTNWAAISGRYGNELNHVITRLPTNAAFIDIGANHGIFSLIASKHLTNGIIFSFEPNPIVYRDFLANIEINACDNIIPVHAAIGAESAITTLNFARGHTGGGNLAASDAGDGKTIFRKVIVLSFTDFAPMRLLIRNRTVLCKIDVEGFEFEVLKSLQQSGVLEEIDALWMEVNEEHLTHFGSSQTELYKFLSKYGFSPELTSKSDLTLNVLFLRSGKTTLLGGVDELSYRPS